MEDLFRINARRQAVAENIEKAMTVGFTPDEELEKALGAGYDPNGEDGNVEKAHQVGDIHPNGKWVWTQLPSGKYDWRTIKKNATEKKQEETGGSKEVDDFMDKVKTFNSKYTDTSKVSVIKTPKGNWDVSYDGHRLGGIMADQLSEKTAKKMGWLKEEKQEDESESNKEVDDFMDDVQIFDENYIDKNEVSVIKTPKGNWAVSYGSRLLGIISGDKLSEKTAKKQGWLKEDIKSEDLITNLNKIKNIDEIDKIPGVLSSSISNIYVSSKFSKPRRYANIPVIHVLVKVKNKDAFIKKVKDKFNIDVDASEFGRDRWPWLKNNSHKWCDLMYDPFENMFKAACVVEKDLEMRFYQNPDKFEKEYIAHMKCESSNKNNGKS